MPIGVIVNALAVILGGLTGAMLSKKKQIRFHNAIMIALGISVICMGANSFINVQNMPVVILAVVLGTIIGELLNLEKFITGGLKKLLSKLKTTDKDDSYMSQLVTFSVIACASATGIYGALLSGITGDHTILISKAVLDFFTALLFAISLSYIVAGLGIMQFVILGSIFACSKLIMPILTEAMILDFVACGGVIMLATGLKVANIKNVNIANMIPALVIVMPMSYLYSLI